MKDLQTTTGGDLSLYVPATNVAPTVKEIMEVLDTKTVGVSLPPEIFNAIKPGYYKSYADTGFKMGGTEEEIDQNAIYQITEIMRWVTKTYPGLRLGEISIAFSRGIRKAYGDYMGLSVISFCNFLDGYVKDTDRKNALIERAKANEAKPVVPTFNEVFDIAKSNALNALKDIENGKDITFSGSVVYDFLEGIGLIELDREEIIEIRKEARRMIVADYGNKVEMDKFKRMDNALIIEALLDPAKPQDKVKHLVKARAKCMAVKTFMQGILMEESDLGEMIESKRAAASNTEAPLATDR